MKKLLLSVSLVLCISSACAMPSMPSMPNMEKPSLNVPPKPNLGMPSMSMDNFKMPSVNGFGKFEMPNMPKLPSMSKQEMPDFSFNNNFAEFQKNFGNIEMPNYGKLDPPKQSLDSGAFFSDYDTSKFVNGFKEIENNASKPHEFNIEKPEMEKSELAKGQEGAFNQMRVPNANMSTEGYFSQVFPNVQTGKELSMPKLPASASDMFGKMKQDADGAVAGFTGSQAYKQIKGLADYNMSLYSIASKPMPELKQPKLGDKSTAKGIVSHTPAEYYKSIDLNSMVDTQKGFAMVKQKNGFVKSNFGNFDGNMNTVFHNMNKQYKDMQNPDIKNRNKTQYTQIGRPKQKNNNKGYIPRIPNRK